MSSAVHPVLRVRAARYGWATVALVAIVIALVVWALSLLPTSRDLAHKAVLVPLDAHLEWAGGALLAAVGLFVLATFVGLAALQTSAAMQVLSPDRRIPPPPPPAVRGVRHLMLGPLERRVVSAEHPTYLPPSVMPSAAELAAVGTAVRCTVLVPAHNEEAILGQTLASLAEQTRQPDRVVVIADNCTDATVEVARRHGVEVVETTCNTEKKAGALNQVLADLLPRADRHDVVLVMDADSTLSDNFLEVALGLLEDDPDLIAVGGLFYGDAGGRLVGQFQRNEYGRYQRLVARKLGRVFVLTGTASVIRSYALRAVADARGTPSRGHLGRSTTPTHSPRTMSSPWRSRPSAPG